MLTRALPLLRLFALLPFAALGVVACGGKAFTAMESGGSGGLSASAGSTSSAGSAVGGAASAGASSGGASNAGASNGGSATAGSSAGGTPAAGAGGGGAGGAGSGGTGGSDIHECTQNTDCELVPVNCGCGCGSGTVSDYDAINSEYVTQYNAKCAVEDCVPCEPPVGVQNPAAYFVPTCQASLTVGDQVIHECRVVDLRQTPVTACVSDADCNLRADARCCPGCDGQLIAINTAAEGELESLVCPAQPVACGPSCAPPFNSFTPRCQGGLCNAVLTACGTAENPCGG